MSKDKFVTIPYDQYHRLAESVSQETLDKLKESHQSKQRDLYSELAQLGGEVSTWKSSCVKEKSKHSVTQDRLYEAKAKINDLENKLVYEQKRTVRTSIVVGIIAVFVLYQALVYFL